MVRSLPGLSADHRLLASLRHQLPLLAEAAPDPLLEALEHLLEGDGSLIRPIFSETKTLLAPHSAHPSLLFALEILAWDPVRLRRVTQILAKLANIDPGGRLANSGLELFFEIFSSRGLRTQMRI